MNKCGSILFLILAAVKFLESAEIPTSGKQVNKGSESGEWIYESFSVSVGSEDGSDFKIDKSERQAELIKKYEQFKAKEEEKKLAAKMAELAAIEAEIEAKKAEVEAKKAAIETRKLKKNEVIEIKGIETRKSTKPIEKQEQEHEHEEEVKEFQYSQPPQQEQQEQEQEQEQERNHLKSARIIHEQVQQQPKHETIKQQIVGEPVQTQIKDEDDNDEIGQIEVITVPEEELKLIKQTEAKRPQSQAKRVIQPQKSQSQLQTRIRLSHNRIRLATREQENRDKNKFYDSGSSSASDKSGSDSETDSETSGTDTETESEKEMTVLLKTIKQEDIKKHFEAENHVKEAKEAKQETREAKQEVKGAKQESKEVKEETREVEQETREVEQAPKEVQQESKQQSQSAKPVNLNLARLSARVPAASPIVLKSGGNTPANPANSVNPVNPSASRRSILKQPNQGPSTARKSVTLSPEKNEKPLKNLVEERKSRGINFNEEGFYGDDEEEDYFAGRRGRQTQGHAPQFGQSQFYNSQPQPQDFYETQMMTRMSTDHRINSRQSHSQAQAHPSQYVYDQEQTGGHHNDLSGIRLGFCESAVLGTIANIRMIGLKYPRQANAIERKKTAQFITTMVDNFPCEKEKEVMKRVLTTYPPIYTERKSFNKWATQFTRTVLKETKCPVGLSMSSLLIPLNKKK